MVTYIRSDLDFILAQIKIAEAHAAGQPLYGPGGLIPAYNIAWGLRTVDGTYNHLLPGQTGWGSADRPFNEGLGTQFRTVMVDVNPGPGVTLVPMSYAPTTVDPDGPDLDGLPGGPGSGVAGDVFDPTVRTISNLIVDQTLANPAAIIAALQRSGVEGDHLAIAASIKATFEAIEPLFEAVTAADLVNAAAQAALAAAQAADPNDPNIPALQAAADAAAAALADAQTNLANASGALDAVLEANGIELDGANVKLTNLAPDEGLSASFNSWFTLFGQFFDHGLDLVGKGGSGTVFVPLQPDDPLYVEGSNTNFMVLTRATVAPGGDGVFGTADDVRPLNTTTSFVDQNQTYASHASHQVFLRQYELNANGDPVATGKLIVGRGPDGIRGTSDDGGMATWADVKAQAAELLGIQLLDVNVGNIPLLATDEYGNFIRGANGYPMLVTTAGMIEGDPTANGGLGVLVDDPSALPPYESFRTGHAFLADIAHTAVPDGLEDGDTEVGGNIPEDGFYDDELLDAHFMAGDGRANENIGLTAVHHVFHSEHNRLVEHTKAVVLATGDAAFIAEWMLPDGSWNGERLFQAAKFGNEMEYQHLVFEEFARKVQPAINTFLVPDGFDTTFDPTIVAEFAHVVYRFGHSMLTESIDRFDPAFVPSHISLIEGFLNPLQYQNNGTAGAVDADIAAGAIIRGMTRQVGNEIDEFVTSALRNNLLGLPLDLATINLARGRDTGVPTLQAVRAQFYEASNQNILLKPYVSWVDYAGHLKNEASIINFIAAYGTHDLITGQTTIEGKRDAALAIITGVTVGGIAAPADAEDFLNGTGDYADDLGGLNNVDLWIGGLAEEIMPFGGMLGSTFGYVFEIQLEMLQSGDRFYYLQRLDGLHLFSEMENNSFAAMIMRNTNATHLPSDVFSTPGLILEVDTTKQFNDLDGDGDLEGGDPTGGGLLTPLVIRTDPSAGDPYTNYLRYTGGDHVVLGGTEQRDELVGGIGDDTLYGDGNGDFLDGGFGNDILNGGDGDDVIVDAGGDDNIKAGSGNDVVHAGPGLDLVMGGPGQDFIFLGTDEGSEVFAGEGNDFIYGNKNAERILGNEGNDWIETGTFDGAPGDNFDEVFAHDGIDGHDVFLGDGGFDEFIGEGGDDIMVGSAGRGKMAGMSGFDWATYKDSAVGTTGVNVDLSIPIIFDEAPNIPANAALDEFQSMEGLSGSSGNDILRGTNILAEERLPFHPVTNPTPLEGYQGSALDAQGIALISGLQAVLGAGVTSYSAGDIILGGDGNDVIAGQMGDDIIDGDKWLDVQIGVFAPGNTNHTGTPLELHDSMTTLAARMFAGDLNPGQLAIVRTIRNSNSEPDGDGVTDVDTAVFGDLYQNYTRTLNNDGTTTVAHVTVSDGLESDGVDRLRGIEKLRFADFTIDITQNSTGQPVINDPTPTEGQLLTANTAGIADPNGLGAFSYQWQSSLDGLLWSDIAGATNASFLTPDVGGEVFGPLAGQQLRVVVRFTDGGGNSELTVSEPTTPLGVDWDGDGGNDILGGLVGGVAVVGGTEGNDIVDGNGGADTLAGNGGDDDLDGGGGNDTITGGAGDDLITGGGGGGDVAVFTGPLSNYTFEVVGGNLVVSDELGDDGVDTIVGNSTETLRFGALNVGLSVGTAGANALGGTAGPDILIGLDGNDTYTVNNVGDIVVEAAGAAAGVDTVNTSLANYVLAENVENLTKTGAGAFTGTGNALANTIAGNDGADTIDGGDGVDTIDGNGGNDRLRGGVGNDIFNDTTGNDVYVYDAAGFGADTINGFDAAPGGGGQDLIDLSAFGLTAANVGTTAASRIQVQDIIDAGTDDTLVTIRDASNVVIGTILIEEVDGNDITAADFVLAGAVAPINGTGAANTLNGTAGDDTISGLGGNDTINGLTGNDTIIWNANAVAPTDGRDIVNGGTEGAAGDTFSITGNATAEAYTIYTRAAWLAIAGNVAGNLNAATEIVVTRNGSNNAAVIAELSEIEEIRINGVDPNTNPNAAGDTFQVIGDFSGTSLRPNTITIDGDSGDDTVDISALSSAHRIVFRSNGGNDTIIGTLRAQDVVELPEGANPEDYELTENSDGTKTLASAVHSVTFSGAMPLLVPSSDVDEDDEDEDEDDHDEDDQDEDDHDEDDHDEDDHDEDEDEDDHDEDEDEDDDDHDEDDEDEDDDDHDDTSGDDVIHGSSRDDMLRGGAGDDVIRAGSGDDVVRGGSGLDELKGGSGDDRLFGGSDDDVLVGGSGDDELSGGSGDDYLDGGSGDDSLTGGSGDDLFAFDGDDRVTDFVVGEDRIDLSGRGVTAGDFASLVTIAAAGADTLVTIGSDTMRLTNVDAALVTASSFLMADAAAPVDAEADDAALSGGSTRTMSKFAFQGDHATLVDVPIGSDESGDDFVLAASAFRKMRGGEPGADRSILDDDGASQTSAARTHMLSAQAFDYDEDEDSMPVNDGQDDYFL